MRSAASSGADEGKGEEEEEEQAPEGLAVSASEEARRLIGSGEGRRVYLETYGCQMNVSDSEVVEAVLRQAGFERTEQAEEADLVLLNTCAIREHAESKVWQRLREFRRRRASGRVKVGVLGCMAERLKQRLLEEEGGLADLVVGPDQYRALPGLVARVFETGLPALSVQLSLEETYADIDLAPVRRASRHHAFVTVMRGCDNMCSFCVVPFVRGRERSRPTASVLREVERLVADGVREVTLLGQNVNSYRDASEPAGPRFAGQAQQPLAPGFSTVYRARPAEGVRFAELLDRIAAAFPDLRVRFTSPHPKDFPEELLAVLALRPSLAKQLHLPAQSGSTSMLARMRRGYTRDAYLALVRRVRELLPEPLGLSSDFIAGFCGETEDEHRDTLSLLREVRYDQAFMFAYSMRERTHAHRNYRDDVPPEVKARRLREIIDTFHETAREESRAREPGRRHLVLLEGPARRQLPGSEPLLAGRADTGKRVLLPAEPVPDLLEAHAQRRPPAPGDFVLCEVLDASSVSMRARPLVISSPSRFHAHLAALPPSAPTTNSCPHRPLATPL